MKTALLKDERQNVKFVGALLRGEWIVMQSINYYNELTKT